VLKTIDWVKKVLLDTLRIPSISPSGEKYGEIVEVYKSYLKEIGLKVEVHRVPQELVDKLCPPEAKGNPRFIVIGRVGDGKPIIHFNGHYDVVPGGSGWTVTDPFKPIELEGKIYGRGATDMKGGIAAALGAIRDSIETVEKAGGTLEIALVPDEEIGGETGTGYLLEAELVHPDYIIISEPSTLQRIYIGHKGVLWINVTVKGTAAHGSTPWLGVNAFEKMIYVAKAFIEEYKAIIERKKSKYNYELPEGAKPTINLGGVLKSIDKVNVVPDSVSFSIDRRLIIEEDVKNVKNEITKFIDKLKAKDPSLNIELNFTQESNPVFIGEDAEIVRIIKKASYEILGVEAKPIVCIGGLDMRYYVSKGFKNVVTYGPGVLKKAHSADEYVEIEDLSRAIEVYKHVISKILSIKS